MYPSHIRMQSTSQRLNPPASTEVPVMCKTQSTIVDIHPIAKENRPHILDNWPMRGKIVYNCRQLTNERPGKSTIVDKWPMGKKRNMTRNVFTYH